MSASRSLLVCLLVLTFPIVGCGRVMRQGGLGFPQRGASLPTLRLVPENPPRGETPYPQGTRIDQVAGIIYFPPGAGESTIWLRLEVSGWGNTGLTGYEAHIVRGPICPVPPCPCEPEPFTPPCPGNDQCPQGSNCDGGNCEAAFVDEDRGDYVFEGMNHQVIVNETPTGYDFRVNLDPLERPIRDRGRRRYAGSVVMVTYDWCPMMEQGEIRIGDAIEPKLILEDGSLLKPLLGSAIIVQQKAP